MDEVSTPKSVPRTAAVDEASSSDTVAGDHSDLFSSPEPDYTNITLGKTSTVLSKHLPKNIFDRLEQTGYKEVLVVKGLNGIKWLNVRLLSDY